MYHKVKTSDNREDRRVKGQLVFTNGRSWTRRITWLEDGDKIKLKFEDGDTYFETGVPAGFAPLVWDRFKEGQSIEDSVSIFGCKCVLSRRAVRTSSPGDSHEVGGAI